MTRLPFHQMLRHPWIYQLSQWALAPGAQWFVTRRVVERYGRSVSASLVLDVGCGPVSYLHRIGIRPVGVDVSYPYVREYAKHGSHSMVALSTSLPFPTRRFGAVWSFFLFHHLSDEAVRSTLLEMFRVCQPGGQIFVIDGILPRSALRNPLAYWIRRLDRGGFVREEEAFKSLLSSGADFHFERLTYSLNGLELMVCRAKVPS